MSKPHEPDSVEAAYRSIIQRCPDQANGYVGLARVATKRMDWEAALAGWQLCLERFPEQAQPGWFAETGRMLVALERVAEAEAVYRSTIERYPERAEGYVGLARVATKRMDWQSSLEHWNIVATTFKDKIADSNRVSRAQAFAMMGHFDSAEQILAELTDRLPDWSHGWIHRAINATARRDEARARQYWSAARARFRRTVDGHLGYRRFLNSLSDEPNHIVDDYRDVGEDPKKALLHLDELNVSETGPRSLLAARHYARVFPGSDLIHVALVRHMRTNIRHPVDLTELLETTEEICKRFPNSKKAWMEQARALICANRLEPTTRIIEHVEKHFGRCANTDELNAWIAQSEGDFDRAKKFSEELLKEKYSFSVHGRLRRFERIDSNHVPRLREKIFLFCVILDEIDFLPWFFDYYRSIGVDWFFIVDNGSSDGSRELLCRQSDATVFWTDDNFHQASSGMRWINELMSRYGDGNWCVYVDADEQLVVPGSEEAGLRPVVDYMREHGDEVMFGFMLDMYPDKGNAFSLFQSGDDPQRFSPLFDPDYFVFGDWQSPYKNIEGGARDRLFNTTHRLRKAPIAWGGTGVRYLSNHTTTAARVSEVTGALLHYKILREGRMVGRPRSIDIQQRLKNRSPHCKSSHDRYRQVLEKIDLSDFPKAPNTVIFESANQLVEYGLINAIPGSVDQSLRARVVYDRDRSAQFTPSTDSAPATLIPEPGRHSTSIERAVQFQRRETKPDNPIALAGLARASAMEENWDAAVEEWQNCFERFPTHARPDWFGGLAQALMSSGRYKEATQVYRRLASIQGGVTPYVIQGLTQAFLDSRQPNDLVKEYQAGVLRQSERTVSDLDVVSSLVRCNWIADARAVFDLVVSELDDALAYEQIQTLIPVLFDGPARTQRLLECEAAVSTQLDRVLDDTEAELLLAVQLSALLALRDYEKFKSCSAKLAASTNLPGMLRPFTEIRRRLCDRGASASGKNKIFGIGLSKTGTKSLANALEILGFSTLHFVNPLTRELISDDDFHLYDAFTDTPVSFQFERIIEQFPDAKFIYTKRPIQSWIISFTNHFAKNLGAPNFDALRAKINHSEGCRHGKIYRTIHNELYCVHTDAAQAYQYHDGRVSSFFQGARRSQLLEFNIFSGDGWSKLCDFVGRPVPDLPFPWKNKTLEIGT